MTQSLALHPGNQLGVATTTHAHLTTFSYIKLFRRRLLSKNTAFKLSVLNLHSILKSCISLSQVPSYCSLYIQLHALYFNIHYKAYLPPVLRFGEIWEDFFCISFNCVSVVSLHIESTDSMITTTNKSTVCNYISYVGCLACYWLPFTAGASKESRSFHGV